MTARGLRRRLVLGLPTVLGLARRGYFIPNRYAGALPPQPPRDAYPAVTALLDATAPDFAAMLDRLADHRQDLAAIAAARHQPNPARFDQDNFPTLDAAIAYALLRRHRPARLVEIGAGHSTRFFARAVADGRLDTEITCIDPAPRTEIAQLGVRLIRTPVPACGAAPFQALGPGDVLSIDSSHVLMPGSDVDYLLNCVLPVLPAGTLVHIHDIFLPDPYPADWAWRGYGEQLGVVPLLLGGQWEPLFASHYAATRLAAPPALAGLPAVAGARPSSLWLRRR